MKVLRTDVEEASGSAAQYSSTNKLYLLFGVGDVFPVEKRRQTSEQIPGSQGEQSKTILGLGLEREKRTCIYNFIFFNQRT